MRRDEWGPIHDRAAGLRRDLDGLDDRIAYLRRRVAELSHWTLSQSIGAANERAELERETRGLERKAARIRKKIAELV